MAASSSSSEIEVENHPFQDDDDVEQPKGPYEARQVKGGLYVRVDMPGVPYNRVKTFPYSATRTVTFNGKAPVYITCPGDSSERVYAGYVVLDRDPTKLDIEMSVRNGCLRLFFPGAEGVLHFFPSKNHPKNARELENPGSMIFWPCVISSNEQLSHEPNVIIGKVIDMVDHARNCPCCKGGFQKSQLKGQGVCEHKLVDEGTGKRQYVRVDMPGLEDNKDSLFAVTPKGMTVSYEGDTRKKGYVIFIGDGSRKQHRLDRGGREYSCCLILQCTCCKIVDATHQIHDGVLRINFRKKPHNQNTIAPASS